MIDFEDFPDWFSADMNALKDWLKKCAREYGSRIQSLNYTGKNDREIIKANRDFLDHDYATDIITFGYKEGKVVAGDVIIGYETVASNADHFGVNRNDEMYRVLVHGLLHLIGFDDQSEEEKERMRAEEEKCLILRPKILKDN